MDPMKTNRDRRGITGTTLELKRDALLSLIDTEARRRLGLSGKQALKRIQKGRTGNSYVWSDLRLLAALLN